MNSMLKAVQGMLAPVETEEEKQRRAQGPRDRFLCLVGSARCLFAYKTNPLLISWL